MRQRDERRGGSPFRIRRKVFHLFLGTVFIFSMFINTDLKWLFLLILAGGILLSFLQGRYRIPIVTWFLDRYDKDDDAIPGQGPLTFFFGSVMVWFIFPTWVALPAVITLTFGDPMAYTMGKFFGGGKLPWNEKKTLSGLFSFIFVPFMMILFIFGPVPAVIMSVTGGIVESIRWPMGTLGDDNITVPILSASILFLFSLFLSIP